MAIQNTSKNELLRLFEKHPARIDMLPERNRRLVRLFLNMPEYRTLAKNAGVSDSTIARRLRKIANRISSDNFIAPLFQNSGLSAKEMEIIKGHFVKGQSVKTITKNTGLSRYKVNKIIRQMRNL